MSEVGFVWEGDAGLASALADAVVVMAPGGTIVWLNDAFCQLMGMDRAELLGADGLARVHPDELGRAIDGIDYARQFPGRVSVAPYRILGAGGAWLDIELKSGIIDHPDGEHLVLVLRDGRTRSDLNKALRSVAGGEPLAVTARLLGDAVVRRWPNTAMAISIGERDGGREVLGHPLPDLLARHAAGELGHLGIVEPWNLQPDEVVVVDRTEMVDELRDAADAAGFEGFAVAPLADPSGRPGCMVVWFDHTAIARLEFVHSATDLTELLGLALDRRHHLWQLWHVASHDSLTGLSNRTGFFDRFSDVVDGTRHSGDDTAALLFIDLDGLKGVNDRGGHAAGDQLLVDVAQQLQAVVGPAAQVARLGGDEFVVVDIFPAAHAEPRAEALAQAIVDALADPAPGSIAVADRTGVPVAASVGIAVDDGTVSPVRIVERADAAMYRAKSAGRSRWSW